MEGSTVRNLDKRNHESSEMLDIWKKCEDCRDGQTAIHKGGERYLPRLSGQSDDEYKAYKRRAVFYGAMSRTVDAFGGMVMRVDPVIDNDSALLDDVTNSGISIYEFTAGLVDDVFTVGASGLLVEHTPELGAVTLGQASEMGARPYLAKFDAECVINWRMVKGQFVQVILKEDEYIYESEFETIERDIYRVLDLDDSGFYRQRKFIKSAKNPEEFVQMGDDIYPLMNGSKMREVPFYFVGDIHSLPPLIDIVDLNISHYMSMADLENGRHFTGLPTPVISGYRADNGEVLNIGSQSAWVFPDPQAKATYLEFTGQGLGSLEKGLETKEKQMAALGARMLSDSVTQETATAASLRSSGEFSILAMVSNKLSNVLSKACSFMYAWAGLGKVNIKLNTDFLPKGIEPQELQALIQAWQSGAISYQTFYNNMVKGEIIAPGGTFEDEQAAIVETAPVMSAPVEPDKQIESTPDNSQAIVDALAFIVDKMSQPVEPPVVNVAAPIINVEAPIVNVPAPVVNVPAPVINIPEQQAPTINITQPDINIAPPDITVNIPEQQPANVTVNMPQNGDKKIGIQRDASGNITGATVNE